MAANSAPMACCKSATLGRDLQQEVAKLALTDIDLTRLDVVRKRLAVLVEDLDVGGLLRSQKRTVEVVYRGIVLSVAVQDPFEEVRIRIGSVVKTNAICNGLPELFGESGFFDPPVGVVKVDASLFADMKAARDVN